MDFFRQPNQILLFQPLISKAFSKTVFHKQLGWSGPFVIGLELPRYQVSVESFNSTHKSDIKIF